VEGGLLLDVVVRDASAVLKLLTSKGQPLFIRRDALLVLDLGLDVLHRNRWFNFESNGLASERFDEDLNDCLRRGLWSR
jgi:hypothetical protein